MSLDLDELYARHVKPLPPEDRLRLLAVIARDLAADQEGRQLHQHGRARSLLEPEGVGADLWADVEAQDYVRELRAEWDQRAQ